MTDHRYDATLLEIKEAWRELPSDALVLCVDPQSSRWGWAVLTAAGRLLMCGGAKEPPASFGLDLAMTVSERPEGRGGATPASTNNLLTLALAAGTARMWCPNTWWITPSRWKQQVPKQVQHGRAELRLTPAERKAWDGPTRFIEDAHDAACLGLVCCGRL